MLLKVIITVIISCTWVTIATGGSDVNPYGYSDVLYIGWIRAGEYCFA